MRYTRGEWPKKLGKISPISSLANTVSRFLFKASKPFSNAQAIETANGR
jgi:hypothetical protein